MTPAKWSAAALAGVLFAGLIGFAQQPEASRDGRIVFVAWPDPQSGVGGEGLPPVAITHCDSTERGLVVEGRVPATPEVVAVLVSGGTDTQSGVAVGAEFAGSSGLIDGAGVGEFHVVIPWGAPSARFAVADPDSLGPRDAAYRHGLESTCP